IGPERYQVGEEVVEAVREAFGTADGLINRAADGSAYLDLWAANRLALERAGVGQIEVAGICTATRIDEFFSHRAEKGRTGRFGAVMALAECACRRWISQKQRWGRASPPCARRSRGRASGQGAQRTR